MAKERVRKGVAWALVIGIGLTVVLLAGCGSVLQGRRTEQGVATAPAAAQSVGRTSSLYYDFEDIYVPDELKVDHKRSYIFHTGNTKAGVQVLNGYVAPKSLMDFFKGSMPRNNWQFKGSFQAPKTVLLFEKPNKRSVFFIEETTFNTRLEIWVIPTTDG